MYGLDARLPGMVFAVIKHCPTFGGTLAATPAVPTGAIAVVPVSVVAGTGRGAEVGRQRQRRGRRRGHHLGRDAGGQASQLEVDAAGQRGVA